jgi:hypothetical protein
VKRDHQNVTFSTVLVPRPHNLKFSETWAAWVALEQRIDLLSSNDCNAFVEAYLRIRVEPNSSSAVSFTSILASLSSQRFCANLI